MQKAPVQLERAALFVLSGFWTNTNPRTPMQGSTSMKG